MSNKVSSKDKSLLEKALDVAGGMAKTVVSLTIVHLVNKAIDAKFFKKKEKPTRAEEDTNSEQPKP